MPVSVNPRASPPPLSTASSATPGHDAHSRATWTSSSTGQGSDGSRSIVYRNLASGGGSDDQQRSSAVELQPRFGILDDHEDGRDDRLSSRRSGRAHTRSLRIFGILLFWLVIFSILWSFSKWNHPTRIAHNADSKLQREAAWPNQAVDLPPPMLDVDPRPIIRSSSGNKTEKYLAYFPHSGYHNQRISLENALTVAKLLDRTLLVPPVWLGRSIPYIAFDKLYDRVVQTSKIGWEHCKDADPFLAMPAECLGGYWDYTAVSWEFLVDLGRVAATQPLVDRWDMSYQWLEEELGLDLAKDVARIKDTTLYEYRIYDSETDHRPLDKFQKRLDIAQLRSDYGDYKLLHFGTLFGTTRLRLSQKENYAIRSNARASMVFKIEHLDQISDMIRDRLGGPLAYFGVHLRVGDGIFRENASRNAENLFVDLCTTKLALDNDIVASLVHGSAPIVKRDTTSRSGNQEGFPVADAGAEQQQMPQLTGRAAPSIERSKVRVNPHSRLDPLPRYTTLAASPLHNSLRCRGALHQEQNLALLNTPIFLATDSQVPDRDPSLSLFYANFPCIFTLHDFSSAKATIINAEPIEAFEQLDRLRNKDDGVPLAGFLYPLLDAMIAAKGRDMLGTPGSTFSQFSVDVLHRVYHDWPIVEAG